MVYQPMLELLAYLRANGFKTFIVSGGGVEFMRPWAERVYGIPPEQVIGSRAKVKYEVRNGMPVLVRLPEIDLVDDKAGKPVGIHQVIGRRPIAAFGNSDGDFEMLEWTTSAPGRGSGVHRPPHRRRTRVGLRSHVARRPARPRPRRSAETRLGPGRHEAGLESHLPVPEAVTVAGGNMKSRSSVIASSLLGIALAGVFLEGSVAAQYAERTFASRTPPAWENDQFRVRRIALAPGAQMVPPEGEDTVLVFLTADLDGRMPPAEAVWLDRGSRPLENHGRERFEAIAIGVKDGPAGGRAGTPAEMINLDGSSRRQGAASTALARWC